MYRLWAVVCSRWELETQVCCCMWKVPVSIPRFGNVNYPNICPVSPKRGHVFCEKHCNKAREMGFPSELRQFYQHCGMNKADIDAGIVLYYN